MPLRKQRPYSCTIPQYLSKSNQLALCEHTVLLDILYRIEPIECRSFRWTFTWEEYVAWKDTAYIRSDYPQQA